MRLVIDSDVVVAASATVATHADACRALAADMNGLAGVAVMANTDVRAGVTELADVCADVLDLVAIDLDLVAARMRAGGRVYSAVERAAAGVFRWQRP